MTAVLKLKPVCLICSASWFPASIETKVDLNQEKFTTSAMFLLYCALAINFAPSLTEPLRAKTAIEFLAATTFLALLVKRFLGWLPF